MTPVTRFVREATVTVTVSVTVVPGSATVLHRPRRHLGSLILEEGVVGVDQEGVLLVDVAGEIHLHQDFLGDVSHEGFDGSGRHQLTTAVQERIVLVGSLGGLGSRARRRQRSTGSVIST